MPARDPTPRITAVIVSYNTCALTLAAVRSLLADGQPAVTVCVVDNASHDGTPAALTAAFGHDPRVALTLNADNRGFGAANNQALNNATTDYMLLLNPDAEARPGALATLVDFLDAHPTAAIAAPRLVYPDGSLHRSVRRYPSPTRLLLTETLIDRLWPTLGPAREYLMGGFGHDQRGLVEQPQGAALMIRRSALVPVAGQPTTYPPVGLFDEQFFLYFEEVDLCRRLTRAGWEIWFIPEATVMHHENAASKAFWAPAKRWYYESMLKYFAKHYGPDGVRAVRRAVAAGLPFQTAFILGAAVKNGRTPQDAWARLAHHYRVARTAFESRP